MTKKVQHEPHDPSSLLIVFYFIILFQNLNRLYLKTNSSNCIFVSNKCNICGYILGELLIDPELIYIIYNK